MARPRLGVWLHGVHVAELASKNGVNIDCAYTPEAIDRWPGNSPVLSCSLPLGSRRLDATVFAAGLLPEGRHREAMASIANVASSDTHALLARFGRDVAGALVISTDEPDASAGGVEVYSPESLEVEVAELGVHPLALHDDSELSIAGIQNKMLLVALGDGEWGRPVRGRPSTHILKVEDRRYPGMARAEADCLALARAVGLTTVDASVVQIGSVPCLIVSRFDRIGSGDVLERVHQEDLCQALARDPDANRRRGKYQDAGGPSLAEAAGLLDRYAADVPSELDRLVAIVTYTVCIGNADAHGKNIALLHPDAETVALTPLYDTVPTVLWPNLRVNAAMTIGGQLYLDRVGLADIVAEAASWRHDPERARAVAIETAVKLGEAAAHGIVDADSPAVARVVDRAAMLVRGA